MRIRSVAASGVGHLGDMVVIGDVRMPAQFVVEASGDDLPYVVTLSGEARAEEGVRWTELVVREVEGGPGISSGGLRGLPLGQIMRRAVEGFAEEVVRAPTGAVGGRALPLAGGTPLAEEVVRRRPRWSLTDDHLAEVARVYREGSKLPPAGLPAPTVAVKEHFGVPRATAARWVAVARERGLLEPVTKSTTTKQRAVRARKK